tara:strand:+ start:261 stop:470 length:210 start_codon:yes stop_codon:yes gene_type:complete
MFFIVDLVDRVLDHFAEKKEKEKKDGHSKSSERGAASRRVNPVPKYLGRASNSSVFASSEKRPTDGESE